MEEQIKEGLVPFAARSELIPIKRIAVVAGTPFDTELGCAMLRDRGQNCDGFPLASTPDEQNRLQYLNPVTLQSSLHRLIDGLEKPDYATVILFCNSLSTVVNHTLLAAHASPLKVVSPLDIYRSLSRLYSRILLFTANGQTLAGIEKILLQSPSKVEVVGLSSLQLVRAIEAGDSAEETYQSLLLPYIAQLASSFSLQAVVLGCTHFTFLRQLIQLGTGLPVIDIGAAMIELIPTSPASTGM